MASVADLLNMLGGARLPQGARQRAFRVPLVRQMMISMGLNALSLALPIMMLQVYDRIIPHQSWGTLTMLITGVVVALFLDAFLRVARGWLLGWSAVSQEHVAGASALDLFARVDLPSFEKRPVGEHMQNLSALSRLREFYSGQALMALIDFPFAVLYLGLVWYLGGRLALVLFLCAAVYAGRKLKVALAARSVAEDAKTTLMVAVLSGIHTAKSIGMEPQLMRRFELMQKDATIASHEVALAGSFAATISAAFGQLSMILTVTAGCLLVLNNELSLGALSACTLLAGRATQPVQRILGTWLRLQDLSVAQDQAQALFSLPARAATKEAPVLNQEGVRLKNVTFGYDPANPILHSVNLEIERGEMIGISGDKGSGKSTLLQLIAGLLTPQKGEVLVNGAVPAEYGLGDFTGQIGYLPQQAVIFRGTLLDNLTGFQHNADAVERAKATAADLGLDSVVDGLPHGYLTQLNDTASDPVPPGVKQRIALVRVLKDRPSLLIFDDSDRTLDKEGYNRLFRLMSRMKGRVTVIIVSHDQNMLGFADRQFLLDEGHLMPMSNRGGQKISRLTGVGGSDDND